MVFWNKPGQISVFRNKFLVAASNAPVYTRRVLVGG
jgi:hypothetical protein